MSITITVPNDDHVALRAMAKALEEIAIARGAPAQGVQMTMGPICTVPMSPEQEERLREKLKRIKYSETRAKADATDPISQVVAAAEVDTTSQQVESLATHVITSQKPVGEPVYLGGGNLSQGYRIEVEELITTDATGTPWDERIHSASKALNSDGTWRLRRKPADKTPEEWATYVKWVEEDIHTVLHGQSEEDDDKYSSDDLMVSVASASPDVEPYEVAQEKFTPVTGFADEPPVTPAGDDFHVDAGEVTEQQIAAIPAPPLPLPPVLTPAQEAGIAEVVAQATMTFPDVMKFLTERHARISNEQVTEIITAMGLKSIMDLNTQPEHTGPFIARVKALLGE